MSERALVVIAAGGTGGHVFPALAVAIALRDRQVDVIWLGTERGLESRVAAEHELRLHTIDVSGIRGKRWLDKVVAPLMLLAAVFSTLRLFRQTRPACVVAFGGYVSAAGGCAAFLSRTPLLLQEQNAVVGTTNRLLAPVAKKIFTGFPQVFIERKSQLFSGNPLRSQFYNLPTPAARDVGRRNELNVLVMGGSQGASVLNSVLPDAVALLAKRSTLGKTLSVWHQTGAREQSQVDRAYRDNDAMAKVEPFVAEIDAAYAWSDIVIARAGALTVAELSAVGVASVLVPLPSAIDDHQRLNAQWLVDAGAAVLMPQQDLTAASLAAALEPLLADPARLLAMANNARALSRPDATETIVSACMECCDERR